MAVVCDLPFNYDGISSNLDVAILKWSSLAEVLKNTNGTEEMKARIGLSSKLFQYKIM